MANCGKKQVSTTKEAVDYIRELRYKYLKQAGQIPQTMTFDEYKAILSGKDN
jgi:hypothetical protein